MRLHRLCLGFFLGASLALTGCGYSCTNWCEDHTEECKDDDTNPDDCSPICEIIERRNDDMECDDEFDEVMSCIGDLDDICDADDDKCQKEQENYSDCVVDFCDDHPNNDDC